MRILLVRLTALGDIIHSSAVLQFIKRERPDIEIDWLIEESFREILEHNPYISTLHSINLKSLKVDRSWNNIQSLLSQIDSISKKNYDLVIDLQGLIKSAIVSRLISKNTAGFSFNSAKERIASLLYRHHSYISYSENKIWRNFKLINDILNLSISKSDILHKSAHLFFQDTSISANGKIIFVVGSSMEQKNYPKEKFLEVAEMLQKDILVVWGSQHEREIGEWLSNRSQYISLAPKMNLDQLKYFISTSSIVIGNDTGPTHIAWAMNIPSIVLFGLTPIEQAFQTPINRVIKSSSKINHRKIDKKDYSIREIEPKQIVDEVDIIFQKLKAGKDGNRESKKGDRSSETGRNHHYDR